MSSKDTSLNRGYQYVDPKRIPKWTGRSATTGKAQPARSDPIAPFPHSGAVFEKRATLQIRIRGNEKEEDWEVVSDASGAEDNGTERARKEREHEARLERQKTWQSDQKARMREQLAINSRVVKEDQDRDSRKKARHDWAATGQERGETKPVPNSWLRWVFGGR